MKTVRHLLLERHRDAQPNLDALRQELVRSLAADPSPAPAARRSISPWQLAWQELVVRARGAWTLLTAGALAAVLFDAAAGTSGGPPPQPSSGFSAVEVRAERAALMAELTESGSPSLPTLPPSAPPTPTLGPRRSSLRVAGRAVLPA